MKNLFDFAGKTAVVIGGTSGIGRALSLGLADAGADVVASARRQEQVDETAAAIEERGQKTLRLSSDITDRASLQRLLGATLDRFGEVDVLVNCAGKIKRTPTLTFEYDHAVEHGVRMSKLIDELAPGPDDDAG